MDPQQGEAIPDNPDNLTHPSGIRRKIRSQLQHDAAYLTWILENSPPAELVEEYHKLREDLAVAYRSLER